ncbi:BQ2448_209 [Microbotryum intermedium]|uniref:Glucosamine 6-phosphate N-acetyltransferase n=1 Tax=Microbotryum intermedium TaxID=269621 RepID=A0A238FAD9_9BASI|nr:BQ2448_209 [Microbotryum intermedium]
MTSTTAAEAGYAFDEAALASLPTFLQDSLAVMGLKLRPLSASDYVKGHLELLSTLTLAPDLGAQAWLDRFNELKQTRATYYPLVIVDTGSDQLVATGTLVVERKFLRGAGLVGHIEDISVSPSQQGKGLGKILIRALSALSEELGCYKSILDCDPKNEAFYAKCGYENKGVGMSRYKTKPSFKAN